MYSVVRREFQVNECKHVSFGIRAGACEIRHIAFEENAWVAFVERLNRLKLDPVHLNDVLEDFLVDTYG